MNERGRAVSFRRDHRTGRHDPADGGLSGTNPKTQVNADRILSVSNPPWLPLTPTTVSTTEETEVSHAKGARQLSIPRTLTRRPDDRPPSGASQHASGWG